MEIKEAILNSSLSCKDELCNLVRLSYLLDRDPKDPASVLPFVSRFGGKPDLPIEYSWPIWKGRPLSFIAQINLTELPEIPDRNFLPRSGLLYFFYDAEREAIGYELDERGSYAVLYANPDASQVINRALPDQLTDDEIIIPARIKFEIVESEPGWEHTYIGELLKSLDKSLKYGRVVSVGTNSIEGHRILGYPMPVQTPPAMDCEAIMMGWKNSEMSNSSIKDITREGIGNWELLLQVRSDDELNMYFPPDCGILYYMIKHSDLIEGKFDRVWMIKQFS